METATVRCSLEEAIPKRNEYIARDKLSHAIAS